MPEEFARFDAELIALGINWHDSVLARDTLRTFMDKVTKIRGPGLDWVPSVLNHYPTERSWHNVVCQLCYWRIALAASHKLKSAVRRGPVLAASLCT